MVNTAVKVMSEATWYARSGSFFVLWVVVPVASVTALTSDPRSGLRSGAEARLFISETSFTSLVGSISTSMLSAAGDADHVRFLWTCPWAGTST